nr:reverse transcriptase domain-containing protein [Tanacetum cinerariifolium]
RVVIIVVAAAVVVIATSPVRFMTVVIMTVAPVTTRLRGRLTPITTPLPEMVYVANLFLRSRADPTLLNDLEMAAEGNADPPVPDLRTMEELCQPSLNGRGRPIAPIAIQATNFRLKNDMIQQVQNSCQFHGLSATVGQTQNVYAVGAYQGKSYQPQGNRNLLSYRSDNYLGPPGFNKNQNRKNQNQNFQNQNRNQGNLHPQWNNQGRNQLFQGASHGQNPPPAYQAPAYQAPGYQAPVHQPQIPQPQVVITNEFTNFMKANDAILKNMQTNMTSLTNSNIELKNMFGQFMKMNTASSIRVVRRDPEETATPSIIIHSEPKSKDKGKRIMVEEPKPLKKQAQIEQDEAYARELERKPQTEAQAKKNMMIYLRNMAGFKMGYFKGMSYDDICPIFKKKFNSNVVFLEKIREQMEEENSKALKRASESQEEKATKKQKLDEEVEELKKHLKIIPNDEDDVYSEATPLAHKVPVVDYEIYTENNKPYYKIIRDDGSPQLFLSFLSLLRNFDREDLEVLWQLVKEIFDDLAGREKISTNKVHLGSNAQQLQVVSAIKIVKTVSIKVSTVMYKLRLKELATPEANGSCNEAFAIPEQTVTGKEMSNPFIAGSLPKPTLPTRFCAICCVESGNAFIDDLITNSYDDLPNSSDHLPQHQTHSFESNGDPPQNSDFRQLIGEMCGIKASAEQKQKLEEMIISVIYALTTSPTIRTSCIKQFWTTAKVKTINDEVQIQALIDEKRVNIKESSIRRTLKLDDVEGTSCLAIAEIFDGLAKMGYEKLTMASSIICLDTNQKFNFFRYILLSLVKNIEDIYDNPSLTKKVFANMKRVGTGFCESTTIPTEPSTSKPHNKHKSKKQKSQAHKVPSPEPSPQHMLPLPSNDPLPGGQDLMKYQALKRKPLTEAQARKIMIIYLKSMFGFKMNYFKGMIYNEIRPLFVKHFNYNQAFLKEVNEEVTLPEKEVEVKAHKREGESLEKEKLLLWYQKFLLLITRFTLKETNLTSREDLESLWKLVKERFEKTEPKNYSDDYLLKNS